MRILNSSILHTYLAQVILLYGFVPWIFIRSLLVYNSYMFTMIICIKRTFVNSFLKNHVSIEYLYNL